MDAVREKYVKCSNLKSEELKPFHIKIFTGKTQSKEVAKEFSGDALYDWFAILIHL